MGAQMAVAVGVGQGWSGGSGGGGIWVGGQKELAVVLGDGGNDGREGGPGATHQVHRQLRVTLPASIHLAVTDPFAACILLAHPACLPDTEISHRIRGLHSSPSTVFYG